MFQNKNLLDENQTRETFYEKKVLKHKRNSPEVLITGSRQQCNVEKRYWGISDVEEGS